MAKRSGKRRSGDPQLRVVGEGVETRQQFEFLRALGCNEAQGYLIGRPMPAADALAWLRNGGRQA